MKTFHPTSLACQDVVELVTELLDGGLEPRARAYIEQHLLVCPPCTVHLGQVRTTIALAGELAQPASGAVAPSLLAAFRKTRKGEP